MRLRNVRGAREALEEAVDVYCTDVPAAEYDIDMDSVVANHRRYGENIDVDSAALEISAIVKDQVKDDIRVRLSKLSGDMVDDSFVDNLDVDVSGSYNLLEVYLRDEPEDYYEEHRDLEADNWEIECIFER